MHFIGEFSGYPREHSLLDLHGESKVILGSEWRHQRTDLVQEAPNRPYVGFIVVLVLVDEFGTHVVGCTYTGLRVLTLLPEHLSQPEVPQLHIIICIQEDVGWFYVSMEDLPLLPLMYLIQRKYDLGEYLPDGLLRELLFLLLQLLQELG